MPAAIFANFVASKISLSTDKAAAKVAITVSPAPETSKTSFDSAFNFITFFLCFDLTALRFNGEKRLTRYFEKKCSQK